MDFYNMYLVTKNTKKYTETPCLWQAGANYSG